MQVYHARRAVKTSHFSPCRPSGMPQWRTAATHQINPPLSLQSADDPRAAAGGRGLFSLGSSLPPSPSSPRTGSLARVAKGYGQPRTPLPLHARPRATTQQPSRARGPPELEPPQDMPVPPLLPTTFAVTSAQERTRAAPDPSSPPAFSQAVAAPLP